MDRSLTTAAGAGQHSQSDIAGKARTLLQSRNVAQLASRLLDRSAYMEWLAHSLDVQRAIYLIDAHFEENREVNLQEVQHLWRRVALALSSRSVRVPDFCSDDMNDLRLYQVAEERIHAFDTIHSQEFNRVLQLKASDVSLARRLVWAYSHGHVTSREILFWRSFDEASELLEDIYDIDEDIGTWNFNFWTYSFMAGGDLWDGAIGTWRLLKQTLHQLELQYAAMLPPEQGRARFAYDDLCRQAHRGLNRMWWQTVRAVQGRLIRYASISSVAGVAPTPATPKMVA